MLSLYDKLCNDLIVHEICVYIKKNVDCNPLNPPKNHSLIGKITSENRNVFSLDCLERNFSQCDKSLLTDYRYFRAHCCLP